MAFSVQETISKLRKAVSRKDIAFLREISSNCSNTLISEPSNLVLNLAILSYAFSKLSEKQHVLKDKSWFSFSRLVEKKLKKCFVLAESGDLASCESLVVELVERVGSVESRDRRYVRSVVEKARLKIASRLYAQGISLGNAAEITGVSKRDVAHYSGKTMVHDRAGITKNITERLGGVLKLFGKKKK